jgi:hypothetical protein
VESDPIHVVLPLAEPLTVGLDLNGHIVVDPVRPPPVVAPEVEPETIPQIPEEGAARAPLESSPAAASAPVEAATAAVEDSRQPAMWEWITMAVVALASMGLLAWWGMRSRAGTTTNALDATLARYREALASSNGKPAGAATT